MLAYALTIFSGAFLLFLVQPLLAKFILPWFGGSSSVWTTCLLFFQVLLLCGYSYAHLLQAKLRPAAQAIVHCTLLAVAVALLPITPGPGWRPEGGENPTAAILFLLAGVVAVPGLALASTGPLTQRWFSRTSPGASPYRLYALSNVGSLLALVGYPVFVEPNLTRTAAAVGWSWGFAAFALLSGFCALRSWKRGTSAEASADALVSAAVEPGTPGAWSRFLWFALPACACVLLLAVTNELCVDVAVIPFLWVLPLGIYLLTFILCFDGSGWYPRALFAALLPCAIAAVWWMLHLTSKGGPSIVVQIFTHAAALFVCCMVCHGELVRRKPHPRFLTSFYLGIAGGGAVGGILVALVAPLVFDGYFELHVGLVACFALALAVWLKDTQGALAAGRPRWAWGSLVAASIAVTVALAHDAYNFTHDTIEMSRGFYGVLSVSEHGRRDPLMHRFIHYHGNTVHGVQFDHPSKRRLGTSYFGPESGVGLALTLYPADGPRRIGIVGLGAGTLAAYGEAGDSIRYYELDPEVEHMARGRFTFLADTAADVSVVLGDARVSLEREPSQHFNVLVLDAFSGDSIPVHLLTREAFDVYLRHLAPDGIIAVHVSNHYLNLAPVVFRLGEAIGFSRVYVRDYRGDEVAESDPEQAAEDYREALYSSDWVLLTRNAEFLADETVLDAADEPEEKARTAALWTDDRNDLFGILKR